MSALAVPVRCGAATQANRSRSLNSPFENAVLYGGHNSKRQELGFRSNVRGPLMLLVYGLLEGSLLAFPVLAYLLCRRVEPKRLLKPCSILVLIGLIHNLFGALGLSLRGDLADYFVVTIEYLAFCCLVFAAFALSRKGDSVLLLSVLGFIPMACGVCASIPGSLLFLFMAQDLVSEHTVHVASAHGRYETRRYASGGATLDATKYTFETYQILILPAFERHLDTTTLFDNRTTLHLGSELLTVALRKSNSGVQLEFLDEQGSSFAKPLR